MVDKENNKLIGFSVKYNDILKYPDYYLQCFYGNPYTYNNYSSKLFSSLKIGKKNKFFIHSKYIGNIGKNPTTRVLDTIYKELELLENYKIKNSGVIIHLSKNHFDNRDEGLKYISEVLSKFSENIENIFQYNNYIILETPSNHLHLGSTIEELSIIWNNLSKIGKNKIRFCIDTSHIYHAGYSINTYNGMYEYFFEFQRLIGLDKIKVIHLNDSDGKLYSPHSKHKIIGTGNIFKDIKINDLENITDNEIELLKTKQKTNIGLIKSVSIFFNIPIILERNIFTKNSNEEKLILKECFFYNSIPYIKFDVIFNSFIIKIIVLKFRELINIYSILGDNNRVMIYTKAIDLIIKKNNSLIYINKFNLDSDKIIPITDFLKLKKKLENEKGIGDSISSKIIEIIKTWDLDKINKESQKKEFQSIKELSSIKFIGPIKARELFKIGISSLDILKQTNINILKNILTNKQIKSLFYLNKIEQISKEEIENFKIEINKNNIINNIEYYILGSFARGKNISNDIDILVIEKFNIFIENLKKIYKEEIILISGDKKYSGIFKINNKCIQIDILNSDEDSKYTNILYFTGSKEFNIMIRSIAKQKNYKLNQDELIDLSTNKSIKILSEKHIFDILEVNYIPPNKRY